MPGQGNRAGRRRSMRVDLKVVQDKCLANWQQLKGYCEKVWKDDAAMLKAKVAEAGLGMYRSGSGSKWRETYKVLQQGLSFIDDNKTLLIAKGGMPDSFVTQYTTDIDTFNTLWNTYSSNGSENEVDTSGRTKANNDVYNTLKIMLSDGKRIYAKNPAVKKQYSFINLLRQTVYRGSAGMRIELTTGNGKQPVMNAEAVSSDGKYEGFSDSKNMITSEK